MQLPKLSIAALTNQAVDAIVGASAHERGRSLVHDEEDDAQCKQVCF